MPVELAGQDRYRLYVNGNDAAANVLTTTIVVDGKGLRKLIDDAQRALDLDRKLRVLEAAAKGAGETA